MTLEMFGTSVAVRVGVEISGGFDLIGGRLIGIIFVLGDGLVEIVLYTFSCLGVVLGLITPALPIIDDPGEILLLIEIFETFALDVELGDITSVPDFDGVLVLILIFPPPIPPPVAPAFLFLKMIQS